MKTRLITAIITGLIYETIIIAIILRVLPIFGIHIPLWGLVLIAVSYAAYAVWSFITGTRILRKKPFTGLTDMIGIEGRAATPLSPHGFVRVKGELWEASAEQDYINPGAAITVVSREGLKLIVREQKKK